MKRSLYLAGIALVLILVSTMAIQAAGERGKYFPAAGIDLIHHELQVAVHAIADDGSDGELLETLKFQGRMLVERGDPYTNRDGVRQIDFLVKEWEAFAWSNALDTMITYRLTEGIEQDFSSITAQQKNSDYPAEFDFAVSFSSTIFGSEGPVNPSGNPKEEGFFEVPPSGNRRTSPTLYGFETYRIEFDHPEYGQVRFVPKECNDSAGETIVTFDADSAARDTRLAKPQAI